MIKTDLSGCALVWYVFKKSVDIDSEREYSTKNGLGK